MAKLKANYENAAILVTGDSTGVYNGPNTNWVEFMGQDLAAQFPAYTVKKAAWNDTSGAYDPMVTVATGTGPNTLTIYNASVSGKTFEYPLASRLENLAGAIQPDLILMNNGHNESGTLDPVRIPERAITAVESLRVACASASVIVMSQNPRIDIATTPPNIEGIRAGYFRKVAQLMGYGFVDIHQAFVDSGNVAGLLNSDGLHPNAAGSRLWADNIKAALTYNKSASPLTMAPPAFYVPGVNLLPNGDFKQFPSPPALPNWTATMPRSRKTPRTGNQATATLSGCSQRRGALSHSSSRAA
ncbi:SGNH/GDSL hydrolase family protein [Pseudarthrobacter sp. B907]|uniref:SGNH/GDSL hydrolase family protein n=1 Tax=Pseudarthrobacter sp. B907 TaxID=3158261 RepID=UPI0032DA14A4